MFEKRNTNTSVIVVACCCSGLSTGGLCLGNDDSGEAITLNN